MTKESSKSNCVGCNSCLQPSACHEIQNVEDWDEATLTEMIEAFENAQPLVEYRDGEFIFYDEYRRPYAFEAHRADTNAKLLEWIRHMTEKAWVTGLHIHQFVRLAIQHLPQIQIDYNA